MIVFISVFLLFSCNQVSDKPDGSTKSDPSLMDRTKRDDSPELNSGNIIWSEKPASTLKKVATTGKPIFINLYEQTGDLYINF